jgi:hypothetical protein
MKGKSARSVSMPNERPVVELAPRGLDLHADEQRGRGSGGAQVRRCGVGGLPDRGVDRRRVEPDQVGLGRQAQVVGLQDARHREQKAAHRLLHGRLGQAASECAQLWRLLATVEPVGEVGHVHQLHALAAIEVDQPRLVALQDHVGRRAGQQLGVGRLIVDRGHVGARAPQVDGAQRIVEVVARRQRRESHAPAARGHRGRRRVAVAGAAAGQRECGPGGGCAEAASAQLGVHTRAR